MVAGILGRPEWERAEGEASGRDLLYALSDGTVVRMMQWEGDVANVRAGIPRSIDGTVSIEIVVSAKRLPRSEEFWSRH